MLPHEGSIGVIGLVGPFLGLDKAALDDLPYHHFKGLAVALVQGCLLYTSDAADEEDSVDLGGRRLIKKTKT